MKTLENSVVSSIAVCVLALALGACAEEDPPPSDPASESIADGLEERAQAAIRRKLRRQEVSFPKGAANVLDTSEAHGEGHWTVTGTCIVIDGKERENRRYVVTFEMLERTPEAVAKAGVLGIQFP